jgi:hypothetical protein
MIKRRQGRQRQYYRRTYRNDKQFADAERERCKKNIRKRREYMRRSNDEKLSGSLRIPINIDLLATGLLSQWIDSKDPMEVEQAARQLETRGRQLAVTVVSTGSAPDVKDFQTVPLHSLEGEMGVPLHPL